MYDIRQFKPALYVLLLLGVTGFALASQSPGTWILSVSGILLNAWLVRTGRFEPMPRVIANLVTVVGVLLVAIMVKSASSTPILTIGQFLVLLQLVKLYEQRANRDYAQLLVLSLLLMVAAAISTASLVFGIMLIVYLFLSLYCCLLFHLKVETDHATQAIGAPADKFNPATLRQDQRYLSRSMRRLTGLVSAFAVTTAVLTFLFFPRGPGAGLLGVEWKPSQTLTGFNDQVSFQNVARITQNNDPVAWVKLTRRGKPLRLNEPLLLRGITLDRYSGAGEDGGANPYQWSRTITDSQTEDYRSEEWRNFGPVPEEDDIHQEITLQPTGTTAVFAIGGIAAFKPSDTGRFRYTRDDEVIQSGDPLIRSFKYEVISRNRLWTDLNRRWALILDRGIGNDLQGPDAIGFGLSPNRSSIDPKIEEFARRPEVSGSDGKGSLAARRVKGLPVSPLDAQIAEHIDAYLRHNFSYTLDLTDARRIAGQDPLVAFLYDLKRGHCEYFAGAMTLLCQSLGMQARMVVGFKSDEYNGVNDMYVVRQSHAHAWVEVLTSDGTWLTFDPTSAREASAGRHESLWQRVRHVFDFFEYTWANSVVAYDRDSRNNLIQNVDRNLTNTAVQGSEIFRQARSWLDANRYPLSSTAIGGLIGLMIALLIVAVGWFVWEKWRLRRRARRIGLDSLPTPDKIRLARQLGFYDELVRLLERRQIHRAAHLTPMEFSDSLTFLPSDAFDAIQRLTDVFYRVRYGRAELTLAQRRHLSNVLARLELTLGYRHWT